jgi:hypothetical protein
VATADGVNRCALHDWRPPTRASREPGSRHSSRGGRRARIVEAVGDGAAARGKPIVACSSTKDSVYGSGTNERSGANRERRVGVLFCNQVGCMLRRGGHSRRTRRDDSEISTAVSPNCRSRSSETRARIWVSDRHSVSEVSRRVQKTGAALSRRDGRVSCCHQNTPPSHSGLQRQPEPRADIKISDSFTERRRPRVMRQFSRAGYLHCSGKVELQGTRLNKFRICNVVQVASLP